MHRHAASVCVVALDGVVHVRSTREEEWCSDRSAVIPAGHTHALDARGAVVGVIYNDPHEPYFRRLSPLGQGLPSTLEREAASSLAESLRYLFFAQPADHLRCLSRFEEAAASALEAYASRPVLDRRVRRVVAVMREDLSRSPTLDELAQVVALSPSRLLHLFTEQTGVPLRRFRIWLRFRHALEAFASGASLTTAAVDAGFASSAHFSHAFRAMFGVSASSVLQAGFKPRVIFAAGR